MPPRCQATTTCSPSRNTLQSRMGAHAEAIATYDRVDNFGNKYSWYNATSSPGTLTGTVSGGTSSYTVANGDPFNSTLFRRDGTLLLNP